MEIQYFVGVDIAKGTLDWAVFNGKTIVLQTHSANSVAGIKIVLRLLKSLPDWNSEQVIFCMEHTGLYNAHLLDFLYRLKLPIWLEGSLQIKRAGAYSVAKPIPLMPNELRSTPSGSGIECGCGNLLAL